MDNGIKSTCCISCCHCKKLVYIIVSTALFCPMLPLYRNCDVTQDGEGRVGDTARLTCHTGYLRPDGGYSANVQCLPQQIWNDSTVDCQRKLYFWK